MEISILSFRVILDFLVYYKNIGVNFYFRVLVVQDR